MGFKFQAVVYPLLLVALVGCTSQPDFDAVYTRLNIPSLETGGAIPDPEEAVVLTVSGQIGAANKDQSIIMDIPTIESVGLVEYTVEDPFEKEQRTFSGVLMKDLLELWKVSPDATVLTVTALNDYQIDVPLDLAWDYPVMFALKQDGEYMTPAYRGPAMLVFPNKHYKFELETDSYWAWQIKTIAVK